MKICGMAVATPDDSGVGCLSTGVETTHHRGWVGVTARKCFRILMTYGGGGGAELPRMPKLAKIAESESRRSRIQFTLHENGSCIEAGTNSRNSTGSDCEESGASNMLGLSSGALSAAQPQNRADAALRRVRLKHAQLNGLNLRVTADRTAIAGLSRTGTGRAEQGKKEFDFDR